jgi:Flp pilus assembly protein TadD
MPSPDPAAGGIHERIQALLEAGDLVEAEQLCREGIAADPRDAALLTSLAGLCGRSGRWQELRDLTREALSLDPDHPRAHNHLGVALREEGDLDAAIASYRRALAAQPDYAGAHNNLAVALQERGDLAEAAEHYRLALAQQSDLAQAHTNLGVLLLLQGDYAAGWAEYEWRHAMADAGWGLHVRPLTPPWDGRPLAPGQTLRLVCEQGLGDTIQFMRYALPLRQQGQAVGLCAQEPLLGLIRASGLDADPISPRELDPAHADPWLPLLSLPGILGISPERPLLSDPYLHPPQERLAHWRARLSASGGPIVAIAWQGNPLPERSTLRGRSLPLETFAPLAAGCAVRFVSLQKGYGAEQRETCTFRDRFVGCQEEVDATWDFLDAAAILACCDLVISSDTAVAHLAGGLGLPTWLLLQQVPDWRWGLEGDTSFWYPSLRLFRQRRAGDWDEVLARVTEEVQALLALQALFGTPSAP